MAHTHTTPRRMAGPTIAHLVVADSSHPHPMAHQEPLPGLSPCLAHPRVGKTDAAAAQPWKPERNAACSGCDALDSSLGPRAFSSHFPHGRYTSGLWWLNAALH